MREGLRSRQQLGKPENDKVSGRGVVQTKGNVNKQEIPDLSAEGLAHEREALNLKIEKKEPGKVVKEEGVLDWDIGKRSNVGLTENGSNRRVLSCGDNVEAADIERKVKREEESNDKVPIGGRVLRSMLKKGDGKKSGNADNNVVLVRKSRECGGLEKIKVKADKVEGDEFVGNGYEKKKEGNDKRELKRKRGRPPKMKMKNQDSVLQRKRGRPPKAGQNYNFMKVTLNGKGKVRKGKKGLTIRDGAETNSIPDMCSKRRSFGKELKKVVFSPVKTENNEVASPLRSNSLNAPVAEKSGKNKAKQLVRGQIMELLMAAGWTVDYRPRNGREYNDAVYVSLDGKTHWSITLAYNTLKMHYEDGDGEGKVYRPGFKFTPIPEEEFKTLTKVINKKSKSKQKLKHKREKGENKVNGVNKRVKKEKQGSVTGLGKSMKGKMKRKWSLMEEDNRMLVPIKDHKRQKTQNKKRSALLVRNAEEIDSEVDGYVPYNGKRTVLAWMIDLGTVLQNGKVYYMNHKRKCVVLEGGITGDGIHCNCCNEIVTISEFEAHARSKLSDPFKNIYIEGGTSLLQCLLDSWNKQDESERKGFHFIDVAGEDPNDDTCGVCGDGGDLICCDGCPSTFHQSCLDIIKFPFGDWHCIYCCCKFCGLVGGSTNQRDDCDDFTKSSLLTCCSCEQKYHRSCIEVNHVQIDDSSYAFCGNRCQELFERLKMLLGVKHEIGDGFSWTFIHRSDVGSDALQIKSQMVECNSKLAVALLIMDECFMPYIDHRSGINLIHSVLYNCGSNFNRLNHSGFITAILERGDEIICAASIRIHGNQLAEMPFIGTRNMYRRQGMCRRLLSAIECALSSLNVGLLVIPAIAELRETWTLAFGFEPLDLTSKQIIKNMNLLVFPHVDMLQKKIPKHSFADENLIPTEVSNPQLQNQKMHEVANNCYVGPSGSDMVITAGVPVSNACQINDKSMSIESGPRLPDGLFNDSPVFNSETLHHNKCSKDVKCEVVCRTIYHNLPEEDKGTIKAHDYVSRSHYQAEDIHACQNATSGCIILARDGKTVDSDKQLSNCYVSEEGRQFLTASHISSGVTKEGHYDGASSHGTENNPDEAKVVDEIVANSNSAEDSPHRLTESIPLGSQIVFCTRESKDSADSIYLDSKNINPFTDDAGTVHHGSQKFQVTGCVFCSHKISDSCELISNHDCVRPHSIGSIELHSESVNGCGSQCRLNGVSVSGEVALPTCNLMHLRAESITEDLPVNSIKPSCVVSELNADDTEACAAETPNLQTRINSGDYQSVQMASDSCEEIANIVNESSKVSSAAEFSFLPADGNVVLKMDQSLELPELGLQVDQAAQSNAPSLCSPNAAGVALHCASAGGTSCGSTEVIVLSNQAS